MALRGRSSPAIAGHATRRTVSGLGSAPAVGAGVRAYGAGCMREVVSTIGGGVFEAATLGPITLRNRIVKAATFEGRSPRRVVTDDLITFHREVAAGGVGMSTVAYCAVSVEGSTDGRTIVLGPEDVTDGLARLAEAIH